MTNLEMIQRFQDAFGTTYTVAKEYLEEHEWDILEAFVAYERNQASAKNTKVLEEQDAQVERSPKHEKPADEVSHGAPEVDGPKDPVDDYVPYQEEPAKTSNNRRRLQSEDYAYSKKDRYDRVRDHGQGFVSWVKRAYAKAKKHRLNISRNNERITSMKLSTLFWLIILAVFTFFSVPFLLIAFIVSLFFGVNYQIEGPGEVRHINYTLNKVTNWVDTTFKEKDAYHNRHEN